MKTGSTGLKNSSHFWGITQQTLISRSSLCMVGEVGVVPLKGRGLADLQASSGPESGPLSSEA